MFCIIIIWIALIHGLNPFFHFLSSILSCVSDQIYFMIDWAFLFQQETKQILTDNWSVIKCSTETKTTTDGPINKTCFFFFQVFYIKMKILTEYSTFIQFGFLPNFYMCLFIRHVFIYPVFPLFRMSACVIF